MGKVIGGDGQETKAHEKVNEEENAPCAPRDLSFGRHFKGSGKKWLIINRYPHYWSVKELQYLGRPA